MDTEDFYNLPILVEDAASMLRKNISKNEKPYVASSLKYNNILVDEWKKSVLLNIADSEGKLRSGKIAQSWMIFEEGKTIYKYMQLKKDGLVPSCDEKVAEFWKEFFQDLSVEEMKGYGWGVVARGWSILNSYIQDDFVTKKWERLYSLNEDPLHWEKNSYLISDIAKGNPHPFWSDEALKDVQQKVDAVLSNPVKPSF